MSQKYIPKHKYLTPRQIQIRLAQPKKHVSPLLLNKGKFSGTTLPMWGTVKSFCPTPFDQGQLGSCTANAFCGAYMTICNKKKNADAGWIPSRLWVYYWERVTENPGTNPSTLGDTGADVTDADSYVQKNGVCSDSLWPYNISTFDQTPSADMVADALKHKITSSKVIPIDQNLLTNIETVVNSGSPVLTAISVYQSFEGNGPSQTGMIPIPNPVNYNDPNDPQDPFLGGHEVLIVGYSHDKQLFTFLNSWGSSWGNGGFGYLPYAYISNPQLGQEFCVIDI
jgi:hypothetical protein